MQVHHQKKYVKTFKMQAALSCWFFYDNPRQNYWLGVVFEEICIKSNYSKTLWPKHTSCYIWNCLTLEHSTCGAEMSSREAASIVDMWLPMVQALQVVIMFSNCVIMFQCFRVYLFKVCYWYWLQYIFHIGSIKTLQCSDFVFWEEYLEFKCCRLFKVFM